MEITGAHTASAMALERALSISSGAAALSALTRRECELLWECLLTVPQGGLVVEIGSQLGRSSSLIGEAALLNDFHSIHIDCYVDHPSYMFVWLSIMAQIGSKFVLMRMTTEQAAWFLARLGRIDLAFVDGDHSFQGVRTDLFLVARSVKPGGLLVAHDVGHVHFPGVKDEINQFSLDEGWHEVSIVDSLGVWERNV